jgi:hypothetical protein
MGMTSIRLPDTLHEQLKRSGKNLNAICVRAVQHELLLDGPEPNIQVELDKVRTEITSLDNQREVLEQQFTNLLEVQQKKQEQMVKSGDIIKQAMTDKATRSRLLNIIQNPTQTVLEANTRALSGMLKTTLSVGQVQEMVNKLKEELENEQSTNRTDS